MVEMKISDISYGEWLSLVNGTRNKGQVCNEFELLQKCYPKRAGSSCEQMIHNELAKLQTVLLKKAINKYQKAIILCLEESDLEIVEIAFRNLKKSIYCCLFFTRIEEYPDSIKENLKKQIQKNILAFQVEFELFLNQLALEDNSHFVQDLVYICKKRNLAKIVLE